jgi:histidine triad (HIT) family protein
MATNAPETTQACIFCDIVAGQADASVVYEDQTVVVFMSLHPVTPGHLLVVPRAHTEGLEDIQAATGAHVWSVGHDIAKALRRSTL